MRTTSTFRSLADGLWSVECDAYDKGIHVPLRMPIVRLGAGLLLYSPVALDDEIEAQIRALGEVAHIVAPSLNHTLFAAAAAERFPTARLHGVDGLARKKRDIAWEPLPMLGDELVLLPLDGVPFTNEVVLFHPDSSSLICADMVQNVRQSDSFVSRQMFRAMGTWQQLGCNRWWRFNTRDHPAFARNVDAMLDWAPQRLVMSHGEVVDSGGTELLRDAMDWVNR